MSFITHTKKVQYAATVKTWGRDNVVCRGKYDHENHAVLKPLQQSILSYKGLLLANSAHEAERSAKLALSKTSLQYMPDKVIIYKIIKYETKLFNRYVIKSIMLETIEDGYGVDPVHV